MRHIFKSSFIIMGVFSLNACVTDGVFYASKSHLTKSCTALSREHNLLGRNVRNLMVKSLQSRKSYSTARTVAKSYTNWPVYFIVDGNQEFNQKMSKYKTQYQKIRYAALQNKCTFFRDVMSTEAYQTADSKY
ncbi:MAG: hypothetical protein COB24_05115 [Hyphomicrobiales bacterium]|nr:MAG: hypothetical protein COB24_05115 [Hyphomicrobiales bacterium]